jgi:hypothetical protein
MLGSCTLVRPQQVLQMTHHLPAHVSVYPSQPFLLTKKYTNVNIICFDQEGFGLFLQCYRQKYPSVKEIVSQNVVIN